jgi:2-polyprenyl-6-methoxyphenol hydroxylase-like FAD-dependent oxidoreductase
MAMEDAVTLGEALRVTNKDWDAALALYQKNRVTRTARIVLSGYTGEHDELEARGWSVVAWKANGGYSNAGGESANRKRERLWLSPHCLRSDNGPLFGGGR